ncbi:hypothetical protein ACGFY9_42315 [Streptomyces sp. NPDC048504]|uniref:hypothetical protein n=1 Tax=Streptomyces sp. NPDC048504 TaxID=3365559 RepID=UPI003713960B
MVWTVIGAVAIVAMATPGVIALTTGWLPPALRARVVRPDLWGYGALMSAVGLATEMCLRWLGHSQALLDFLGPLGLVLILSGFLLQSRARRPATL